MPTSSSLLLVLGTESGMSGALAANVTGKVNGQVDAMIEEPFTKNNAPCHEMGEI